VVTSGYIANVDGPRIQSPSPALGADSDAILESLGFSDTDIETWKHEGVI
jgi:crotonobetainyl-CoA:carnitine CoA-transferase CaiB-like acyl-CoA transferase